MKRYNVRMKVDAAVGRKFKHALLTVQSHLAYPMHVLRNTKRPVWRAVRNIMPDEAL